MKTAGHLRSIALAAIAFVGVSQFALAADLSRPPPPAPPPVYVPPPFSWTGFYVGGNLGGAWAHGTVTDTFNPGVTFGGSSNNGVFIGGGQAGFNYQISNFVFGVEGDFDWAANNNNSTGGIAVPLLGGDLVQVTANNRWMATVAARLGVAWDHWLFYGKGGGGWVGTKSFTVTDLGPFTPGSITGGSSTNSGWLAGAGIEWAFANNWTARVEYDYFGLSSRSFTVPVGSLFLGGDTFNTGSNHIQTLTVGINYLFNWGQPVVARY
jgi:outer membrane immunogenic protein